MKFQLRLLFLAVLTYFALSQPLTNTIPTLYKAPKPNGTYILWEPFNQDPFQNGWIHTQQEKFKGKFSWSEASSVVGIPNDKGLLIPEEAKFYGFSKVVEIPRSDQDLVVQYEVKFQVSSYSCGGLYIKLLHHDPNFHPHKFSDTTPFVVMFGPDKCGTDDKVHFIIRHQNPISKEWEEKHMKNPPQIKNDKLSHLYTLILHRATNTYEIKIDMESVRNGSLLTDFNPAFTPPKEIDDPNDKKPSDWVDQAEIDDPNDKKPDDWDESQPAEIPDPSDKKPEGWQDDGLLRIPDPNAKRPSDWDEAEDGVWEAPKIDNPVCQNVGCGQWKPRNIKNHLYRGKWSPKKIKNPSYKGQWAPRKIPNPNYFEEKEPGKIAAIGAVAYDLWTMNKDTLFDNLLITTDEKVAEEYAKVTWLRKFEVEKTLLPKVGEADGKSGPAERFRMAWNFVRDKLQDWARDFPIPIVVTTLVILLTIPYMCWSCCCGFGRSDRGKHDGDDVDDDEDLTKLEGEVKELRKKYVKESTEASTSTTTTTTTTATAGASSGKNGGEEEPDVVPVGSTTNGNNKKGSSSSSSSSSSTSKHQVHTSTADQNNKEERRANGPATVANGSNGLSESSKIGISTTPSNGHKQQVDDALNQSTTSTPSSVNEDDENGVVDSPSNKKSKSKSGKSKKIQ